MIVFNGDSFVENSHLELESTDWRNLYWPKLVAPEHKNIAQSGASNQRIFRTTIDYLTSGNLCSQLFIGWSGIDRMELPSENGDTINLRPDHCSYNYQPEIDTGNIHNHWYKHHHNEWLQYEQFVDYILILQDVCVARGVELWMWNSWHNNYINFPAGPIDSNFYKVNHKEFRRRQQEINRITTKLSGVDWHRWIWAPGKTLAQWAKLQNLDFERYGHPSLSAQRSIADYILNTISE